MMLEITDSQGSFRQHMKRDMKENSQQMRAAAETTTEAL
jgi:hypothetical protein